MTKTSPAAQGTMAGWKLVPVDPTKAMMDAVDQAYEAFEKSADGAWYGVASVYRAMLAAAPASAEASFRDGLDAAAEYLLACNDYGDRFKAEEIRKLHSPASPSPKALPASGVEAWFGKCDAWGAAEWFNRLANAIREQDKAVIAGDEMAMETYRNIAASSAMRLVREYQAQVRAALTSAPAPEDRTREAAAIKLADGYSIVLAMIAAGCSDPQRFAKRMLAEHAPEAKKLEITK